MAVYAVEVNNVTMKFNLAREKVDSLKEYFVKNIKKIIYETNIMQ